MSCGGSSRRLRIVYTITDEALVITVVRVANRREVYRGI